MVKKKSSEKKLWILSYNCFLKVTIEANNSNSKCVTSLKALFLGPLKVSEQDFSINF